MILLSISDTVWMALINLVLVPLIALAAKWLDNQSKARNQIVNTKLDETNKKVEAVEVKTDDQTTTLASITNDMSKVKSDVNTVKTHTNGLIQKIEDSGIISNIKDKIDKG